MLFAGEASGYREGKKTTWNVFNAVLAPSKCNIDILHVMSDYSY